MTDVQTLSTFHALRREGQGVPAPTEAEWAEFVDAQRAEMTGSGFSEARSRSLANRMERAAAQRPDGPSWYALRNIRERARSESANMESSLRIFADRMGQDYTTVRDRFRGYMEEIDRSRSAAAPEGYVERRDTFRQQGLPVDRGTYQAYMRIAREAEDAVNQAAPPRRVEAVEFPNSQAIHSAGYDPHDGRLEVTFRRPDGTTSRTYAYCGVPAEVWAEMRGEDGPGVVYNREVRNRDEYRYASREEEEAGAHRRCAGCGQWWAPGHACPARAAAEPSPAPSPAATEPVAEQPVPRGLTMVDQNGGVHPPEEVRANVPVEEPAPAPAEEAEAEEAAAEEPAPVEAAPVAAAAEPEAPARPEPVTARSVGIYSRYRYLRGPGTGFAARYDDPAYYDAAEVPGVTALRRAASTRPIAVGVSYSGRRSAQYAEQNPTGLPAGTFHVSGSVIYDRPGRGQHTVTPLQLQCSCAQYRETYHCPHVDYVLGRYRDYLLPRSSAERAAVDTAVAQRVAEESLAQDWMRSEELAADARARHAASSRPEDSYTNNFEAFQADHDAALARRAAGEDPIPYLRESALGGQFTRESGRGFGVELEFDFPNTMTYAEKSAARRQIGRELHEAGLTPTPDQEYYHASARRGYVDTHARGWSFEQDCTVSGEIVSPVMFDEPETWQNIEKVCEIVRRNGGVANAKTGSHVHVGAPNMTTQTASELMRMANQHEDVMYRLSQNPERPSHRPMRWCGPNQDVPQGGYQEMSQVSRISSHNRSINYGGVRGRESDHPEIRYWDGTLSPSAIQAQIKVSTAMVQAAERNAGMGESLRNREPLGAHQNRLTALRGRSRRQLTADELREDSATMRSFVDTLFTRREDKAQIASLFAVTKWQRPSR